MPQKAPRPQAAPPPTPEKRPRGRPRLDGSGPVSRINTTLDPAALAIAERIRPGNVSLALREALRYWDEHNPAGGQVAP
jgi:hypothetical protein